LIFFNLFFCFVLLNGLLAPVKLQFVINQGGAFKTLPKI